MKFKIIALFTLIINIIFLSMVLFLVDSKEQIHFELKGSNPTSVGVNENYEEAGFKAEICIRKNCKDLKDKVDVTNTIETKSIGTQEIVYKLKYNDKEYTLIRNIKIKDTVAPVINLKGKNEVNICPGGKYTEEGFLANDNYDGDITDKVVRTEKENEIRYSVIDSSDNKSEVVRKLIAKDETKPTLKLKGNSSITVYLNSNYSDSGFTVHDNCDKNLEEKVDVTSKVDTSQKGTYKVTYSVSDTAGNKATVTRTVVVKEKSVTPTYTSNISKTEITNYIKKKNYKVSVGYVNLVTGDTYYYQPGKVYFGASLVKTVDALYIYEKTKPDAATIAKVKKAISVSDNTAHIQLVKQIGRDKLKAYGQSLGAKHFLTSTTNLYYGDTTVYDQVAVWKHLYKFITTNPKGNELKSYFINTYCIRLLFDGIETTMHKYGYSGSYFHDVGIVFAKQPYIIIVLTKHGNTGSKTVIKDISKKIHDYNKLGN